jgi:hypothetical protein
MSFNPERRAISNNSIATSNLALAPNFWLYRKPEHTPSPDRYQHFNANYFGNINSISNDPKITASFQFSRANKQDYMK